MEDSKISINVKLSENDLVDFYTHNSRKSILMKMLIAFALLIFAAQLIRILIDPAVLWQDAWKWLLSVISLFFLLYFINKSNAKKEFRRNKKLQENHHYLVTSDFIHIKGASFNTVFQWEKLYNMTESRNSFFIWLGKNLVQIIPKRNMEKEEISLLSDLRNRKFRKSK